MCMYIFREREMYNSTNSINNVHHLRLRGPREPGVDRAIADGKVPPRP